MSGVNCWQFIRRAFLGAIAMLFLEGASAQPTEIKREVFLPTQGKGSIVLMVSGRSGPVRYREIGARFAAAGYYTVLVDGNDLPVWMDSMSQRSRAALETVISEAQSAPQALPGKAALVGYSLGGPTVLIVGAGMDAQVSAVVAYYPAITGQNVAQLAAGFRVPVLVLSGAKDQMDCCKIETMRALAAAPKSVPFELVEYPDADHGFNLPGTAFEYLAKAADDAWARTVAFLGRTHPPRHAK